MAAPDESELDGAARTFDAGAARAASRSLKDLLAPAVETLRDLALLADPTPAFTPRVTGSRRRALVDAVRARVTAGIAPAVRAVLEQQARFNEQIVAALLDVVRRLQAADEESGLRAQVERLERRIAALEGKAPDPAKKRR